MLVLFSKCLWKIKYNAKLNRKNIQIVYCFFFFFYTVESNHHHSIQQQHHILHVFISRSSTEQSASSLFFGGFVLFCFLYLQRFSTLLCLRGSHIAD